MKARYFIILIACLFISCKATVTFYDDIQKENEINIKDFLYKKIPDKYNTGPEPGTSFSKIGKEGLVNGLYIKIDDKKDYVITSYIPKNVMEMPSKVVIENYDFQDGNFRVVGADRFSEKKTIIFKNCKFKGFRNGAPYDDNKLTFIFDHCSFGGGVNEININLNWCKIGGFPQDAMNPLKNFKVQNCFIYDLSCEGNEKGTHIDGFQIYGRENTIGGNILFDNVRFEIPSIYYEGNTSYVNACVMLQLEFGNVNDCIFRNLICNGGGKWYPLYFKKTKSKVDGTYYKKGEEFPEKNISLQNVKVSNNFGKIFYPTEHYETAKIENVDYEENLYVSSIFTDAYGKIHVICTNDTSFDKVLKVVTDTKTYFFDIPHCPSNWALNGEIDKKVNPNEKLLDERGKPYKDYRYKDLPFDVDCVLNLNAGKISCYDGSLLLCEVK